jgi:hypothetical protein
MADGGGYTTSNLVKGLSVTPQIVPLISRSYFQDCQTLRRNRLPANHGAISTANQG